MDIHCLIDTTDDGMTYETLVLSNDAGVPVILVTRQPDGRITVTDDEGHSLA